MTTEAPDLENEGGLVDLGDTSFEPEKVRQFDQIRRFMMGKGWPTRQFDDRKFQLGGQERVAILNEQPFMFWAHRFSKQFMNSNADGYKRCNLRKDPEGKIVQSCPACDHYEAAPTIMKDGRNQKDARCGRRQQRFGMNLLVYKTNLEGQLIDEMNQLINIDAQRGLVHDNGQEAQLVYEVYLWVFGPDKFSSLRTLKREWGDLRMHDLVLELDASKPDNFQDFAFTISPNSCWRLAGLKDRERAKEVATYYKEHAYDIPQILGKTYTNEELTNFLTPGAPTAQSRREGAGQQSHADVAAEIENELAGIAAGGTPPPPPPPTPPATPQQAEQSQPAQPPAEAAPAPISGNFDDLLS